jgi:hypothetical protein
MKLFNHLLLASLASSQILSNLLEKTGLKVGLPINMFGLLELKEGWVNDALKSDNNFPPKKLATPTRVRTPSIDRIQFHFNSALQSYCHVTSGLYMNCFLGKCRGFKMLRSFDHLYHGSMVVVGVYEDTKELVVSHRGSSNIQNWLRDFSYELVPFINGSGKKMKVHTGFYGTYRSFADIVNSYLFNLLKDPKYDGYKVIITGHSLGGGTSTLHAADQAENIRATGHEVELFTYHSPRVGDQDFVDYVVSLDIPISRYTNRGDIVSQLPFRHMGFVHIPAEVHLDFTTLFSANPKYCSQEYDEDPTCQWADRKYLNPVDHINGFNKPAVPMC